MFGGGGRVFTECLGSSVKDMLRYFWEFVGGHLEVFLRGFKGENNVLSCGYPLLFTFLFFARFLTSVFGKNNFEVF